MMASWMSRKLSIKSKNSCGLIPSFHMTCKIATKLKIKFSNIPCDFLWLIYAKGARNGTANMGLPGSFAERKIGREGSFLLLGGNVLPGLMFHALPDGPNHHF
jgi:hypothetical protein